MFYPLVVAGDDQLDSVDAEKNRAKAVVVANQFLASVIKDGMGAFMSQPEARGNRCMPAKHDVDKCCHYQRLHKLQQGHDFVGFLNALFTTSQKCLIVKSWFMQTLSSIASEIDRAIAEAELPSVPSEFPGLKGTKRLRRMDEVARVAHMTGEAPQKKRRTGKSAQHDKFVAASKLEADVRITMGHYLASCNKERHTHCLVCVCMSVMHACMIHVCISVYDYDTCLSVLHS